MECILRLIWFVNNLDSFLKTCKTKETVLDHILVHFLLELFVFRRLFELCLIYPIQCLEASHIQSFNVDLLIGCGKRRAIFFVLKLVSIVEVESFVHGAFTLFLSLPLVLVSD